MNKNPVINAVSASAYIVAIASLIFYGLQRLGADQPDTVLAPIFMISLFTLSAAVMGYLFLYRPLELYFVENNKTGAAKFFLHTVGSFAVITALLLIGIILTLVT